MKKRGKGGGSLLLRLCLAASLFGLALIYSATRYDPDLHRLPAKQGAALLAGLVLCFLLSRLDLPALLDRFWWVLLLGNIGLLLLLIPFGNDDGTGNRSWLALPGGLFNLQPAEIGKLLFILLLALQAERAKNAGLNRPRAVLLLGLHAAGLCGLLYLVSGDIGMVTVYLAIYLVMLWAAGLSPLWLLGEILAGGGGLLLLWPRLPAYVRLRFQVVLDHSLDPLGKGFQQERSLLAIGSGRLTGQGWLHGAQTQSPSPSALPARHTDFLFSAAGEELGLLGCVLILLLLVNEHVGEIACASSEEYDDDGEDDDACIAFLLGVSCFFHCSVLLVALPPEMCV